MSSKDPEQERIRNAVLAAEQRYMTRRALLKRGGLVLLAAGVAPSLLAACGGGGEEAPATTAEAAATTEAPPATTEAPPATTEEAPPAEAPAASGTIDFLSWEGYDIPVPMEQWKADNGVELKATYIATHDDIQAKLKGGGAEGTDLITYYQGYKPLYTELGILSPLDESKIPNLANEFPFFASDEGNFWVDPDGTRTGVPWTWGSLGITYDTSAIAEAPTSYDVLFDSQYTGKVTLSDDPVGAYTQAAHILGINVAEMTPDQFSQVTDWLKKLVKQTKGVAASYGDATSLLVSGEAVISFLGWAAMNSFAKDAGKDTVATVLPDEGGYSFCDAWAIPPGADNMDSVYAWINQTLTPETNAACAENLVGGVTVAGAVDFLSPTIASLYPYDDLDALLAKAPFYNNPPIESDEYATMEQVITTWQEVKASA